MYVNGVDWQTYEGLDEEYSFREEKLCDSDGICAQPFVRSKLIDMNDNHNVPSTTDSDHVWDTARVQPFA